MPVRTRQWVRVRLKVRVRVRAVSYWKEASLAWKNGITRK